MLAYIGMLGGNKHQRIVFVYVSYIHNKAQKRGNLSVGKRHVIHELYHISAIYYREEKKSHTDILYIGVQRFDN